MNLNNFLTELSTEEKIELIKDSIALYDAITIPMDSQIRKVAAQIYDCEIEETDWMQMKAVADKTLVEFAKANINHILHI